MRNQLTEQELLEGCLKGKPEMQRALYDRFSRTMLGICARYTRDRMEAEDVLQLGFLKVFTHLQTYQGGSLEGWMKKIFVHESINQFRKTQRSVFANSHEPNENDHLDLDDVIGQMAMEEILEMIARLPEGCRLIFNLYAIEGYKHKEIGDLLGVAESTSKTQYARAKELLKEKIFAP